MKLIKRRHFLLKSLYQAQESARSGTYVCVLVISILTQFLRLSE